jgi:triosephosphate isomerase
LGLATLKQLVGECILTAGLHYGLQRWEDSEERERLKEELRTVTETIDKMITTGAAAVVCSETMICKPLLIYLLM